MTHVHRYVLVLAALLACVGVLGVPTRGQDAPKEGDKLPGTPAEKPADDPPKQPEVVDEKFVAFFDATDRYIDNSLLRVLSGARTVDQLTVMFELNKEGAFDGPLWHGLAFSERPKAHCGSGVGTIDQMSARDAFAHAVLLYLIDDHIKCKAWLDYCVSFNQRCSHEYHVAQWLLKNRVK